MQIALRRDPHDATGMQYRFRMRLAFGRGITADDDIEKMIQAAWGRGVADEA